jgi:Zn finger protein HypA/HybF involved in hydrogenase expression
MTKTYSELLKDPRWQRKRLEILQRDSFTCQSCMDSESTLHVHHKHYIKGRLPWEYEEHELVTLCESCHGSMDEVQAEQKDLLAKLNMDGPYSTQDALCMLAGWANQNCGYDLSAWAPKGRYSFVLGEIIDTIDVWRWKYEDVLRLRDALKAVSSDERLDALVRLALDLEAKAVQGRAASGPLDAEGLIG